MKIKPWQLLIKAALLTYFSVIKQRLNPPTLDLATYTNSPGMATYAPPWFDTKHSLILQFKTDNPPLIQ